MTRLYLHKFCRIIYGEAREDEGSDGDWCGVQQLNRRNSRTNILTEAGLGGAGLQPLSATGDPSVEDVLQLLRQLYILAHEDSFTQALGKGCERITAIG